MPYEQLMNQDTSYNNIFPNAQTAHPTSLTWVSIPQILSYWIKHVNLTERPIRKQMPRQKQIDRPNWDPGITLAYVISSEYDCTYYQTKIG